MATHLRTASNLGKHPIRGAILDCLNHRPGLSYVDLLKDLRARAATQRVVHGTLSWHLSVLERARAVTSVRSGRCRRYFPREGPWQGQIAVYATVISPAIRSLADLLAQGRGLLLAEIQARLPAGERNDAEWLRYQLRRLAQAGLVEAVRQGRENVYRSLPRLVQIVESLHSFRIQPNVPLNALLEGRALRGLPRPVPPPPGAAPLSNPMIAAPTTHIMTA